MPVEKTPSSTEELFRSAELLVRKVAPHGSSCCVVTFDSFTDHRTLERPGFGQNFFDINKIDAVHVIPHDNDWYHYPQMAEAMAHVHAATRGYRRVMTYGSSMGAYAAIRFAGLAGAGAVLALSPQFSIHPPTVPWEGRWIEQGARFDPRWECQLPFPSVAEACVVYDPTDRDARHIAALARHFSFDAVGMPNAGHPVTGCLAEIGLLQDLVLGMCRGGLDRDGFWALVLERLPDSSQYLATTAKRLPAWRRRRRIALMQRAVTRAPEDPSAYRCLGIELRKAKRFGASLEMHRRALELLPGHPNLMLEYSLTLDAAGDTRAAIAVLEDVHRQSGGKPIYQFHLAAMQGRLATAPGARLRRFAARLAWRRRLLARRESSG